MRRTITMFFIVLLISFNLGVLATDHVYIRASKEPSTRPSPNVNVPNPDLPNLSVHGKKVEEELASSLRINPNYQQRHVAGDRVFSTWWGYGHGEKERNLQQIAMNDYTNEIKAHQKSKNSMIGKLKSKLPNLKTKQKERERELNEKYNNAKQEREKARQSMRDIANDANVHKKAGNFNDYDVRYATRMFFEDSHKLGFLSDGRHVSSPRNPKFARSRSATSTSSSPTSPNLRKSRSGKA